MSVHSVLVVHALLPNNFSIYDIKRWTWSIQTAEGRRGAQGRAPLCQKEVIRLLLEVFQVRPTGKKPQSRPRICWRHYTSVLALEDQNGWMDGLIIKCCQSPLKYHPQIIPGLSQHFTIDPTMHTFSSVAPKCGQESLIYLPMLYFDSCHPFMFDNASFSIISYVIYCLQGEKTHSNRICSIL